ncbi:hypothetical protein JTE90_017652 [Oedothorax gibbosus]|uniref:Ribonuclease P protein subunit p29 n=1 Tax=Oedothorax gibbosus TaxID=931172 RepID=A0AAV6U2M9_9ARAC|nr:hypothetical protein JTE90_017652 [Oedothorax gibbosus]
MGKAKNKKDQRKEESKNPLFKGLPPAIEKLSERIGLRKVPESYIKKFIKDVLPSTNTYALDELKHYVFSFDKYKKRRTAIARKKRKTLLNASEQRRLATYKLDPTTTKFHTFVPIHELWKQYMHSMLQLKDPLPSDLSNTYQKLLKADYHGCMLVVVSSNCPNYVGKSGIVIQETKNVFKLVSKEDKIKTIPKKGTVFCFELDGNVFKIYGGNFCYVPYERIRVKFKTKNLVEP